MPKAWKSETPGLLFLGLFPPRVFVEELVVFGGAVFGRAGGCMLLLLM